jgi:5'-nucleotidase
VNVKAIYDDNKKELVALSIDNKPVEDEQLYKIALQGYHFNNSASYLNISNEELLKSGNSKVISTSAQQVLIEYLKSRQNIDSKIEERLVFI